MPANLSPEYKAAEASFRKTRDPRQRLEWLREMLRAIPKHKGTEHLWPSPREDRSPQRNQVTALSRVS
jgi:hypothetical protein